MCICMLACACVHRFSAPRGKRHQILPSPAPARLMHGGEQSAINGGN